MPDAVGIVGRSLRLFAAGVLALAALAGGVCLVTQLGALLGGGSGEFAGTELELKRGQGEQTPNGLLVKAPRPRDVALVLTPEIGARADSAGVVSWSALGLRDDQQIQVVWVSSRAPGRALAYRPTAAEREQGRADLSGQRGWGGTIDRVGVLLRGPLPEPVLISSIALASTGSACGPLFSDFLEAWRYHEPWSHRSINFHVGHPRDYTGVTPVLAVAIWVALAALFDRLLCRRCRPSARLAGAAVLILIGWFALDLRWQGQLWERLMDSRERFAGLSEPERLEAGLGGQVARLVAEAREHLPDEPARVLVLSPNSGGMAGRVRYLLLPHRAYHGLERLPDSNQVAPGDYLLVLSKLRTIRYDGSKKRLVEKGRSLPAERVTTVPGLGQLYRVGEGD